VPSRSSGDASTRRHSLSRRSGFHEAISTRKVRRPGIRLMGERRRHGFRRDRVRTGLVWSRSIHARRDHIAAIWLPAIGPAVRWEREPVGKLLHALGQHVSHTTAYGTGSVARKPSRFFHSLRFTIYFSFINS
jgi:hypothetical protein